MTQTEAEPPMEVELKFRMTDAATGERLIAGDELDGFSALGPARTAEIEDRYVDTADGALARAGYAGRLRSGDGGTVITLKGLRRVDDGGAVHRREELEGPAVEGQPAASWPASDARDAVVRLAGDEALGEIALIRQTRRKRDYGRDGAVVEVSVDDVSVMAAGRVVERFAELELELREGGEAALEPLVDLLSEIEELVPAQTSKLERALAAVHREEPPTVAGSAAPATVAVTVPERDRAP
ncbi:MAG: CYTH domain-containing protein, partial [Candidatus Limnocylindrales bacterium]